MNPSDKEALMVLVGMIVIPLIIFMIFYGIVCYFRYKKEMKELDRFIELMQRDPELGKLIMEKKRKFK